MMGLEISEMPSQRWQIPRHPLQKQSAIHHALVRTRHPGLKGGRGKSEIGSAKAEEIGNAGKVMRRRPGLAGNIPVELLAVDADFPANLRDRWPRCTGKTQIFGKSLVVRHVQSPWQFYLA